MCGFLGLAACTIPDSNYYTIQEETPSRISIFYASNVLTPDEIIKVARGHCAKFSRKAVFTAERNPAPTKKVVDFACTP
jgi:hypothetical protein